MDWLEKARDVIAAGLGLLMVSGVYLDGWAHLNQPTLETFFTPWHAILYSAFALLAGFIVSLAVRRGGRGGWQWLPPNGYGLAGPGVVVFLAGGVGDMMWHEVFGVEVAIDALVSPTHLVLLVGATLMITAPMRAVGDDDSWTAGLATALSVSAAAAAGFFLSYLSVFADAAAATPLTLVAEGAPGHREGELPATVGLGAYIVSTVVIIVAVLSVRRLRPVLPAGTVVASVAAVAVLGAMLTGFRFVVPALAATVAAVLVEVSRRWWPRRWDAWLVVAVLLPPAIWAAQLTGLTATTGLRWPAELWAGIVVLSTLAGGALGLISGGSRAATAVTTPRAG
ncbi:hypothetical protein Aca07nite_71680 [Actinoplanes capillaceus]|uniref:Uncharacterized protein n=1 Tax=Actinoplanes campanulatus TaxID=113559 RepID=A0ABQ3WUQ5_9ACTN|nr:hypothetical protein [Actinoplanes capillaceus]GID49893.1 hypothetical protein Aca07nite_71680 [Actinoplanes capillaceus]